MTPEYRGYLVRRVMELKRRAEEINARYSWTDVHESGFPVHVLVRLMAEECEALTREFIEMIDL